MKTDLNLPRTMIDDVIDSIDIVKNLMLVQDAEKMQENLTRMFECFYMETEFTKEHKFSMLTTYKALSKVISSMSKIEVENLIHYSKVEMD